MNTTVKKARMFEDDGKYYVDVTYVYEDDAVVKEIHIPKIEVPLLVNGIVSVVEYDKYGWKSSMYDMSVCKPLCGTVKCLHNTKTHMILNPDSHNNLYYERVLLEKELDVTLEDIEKKFGRKIRIVNKKSDKKKGE